MTIFVDIIKIAIIKNAYVGCRHNSRGVSHDLYIFWISMQKYIHVKVCKSLVNARYA